MAPFEQRGWVTRSPDPDNGRYTLATLTEAGMLQVATSAPGHVNRVRELVFDPLSTTQQRNLGIALSRIAETRWAPEHTAGGIKLTVSSWLAGVLGPVGHLPSSFLEA
ncbi:MAG: hypothetical protein ABI563_05270 [Specibacter sp.]